MNAGTLHLQRLKHNLFEWTHSKRLREIYRCRHKRAALPMEATETPKYIQQIPQGYLKKYCKRWLHVK